MLPAAARCLHCPGAAACLLRVACTFKADRCACCAWHALQAGLEWASGEEAGEDTVVQESAGDKTGGWEIGFMPQVWPIVCLLGHASNLPWPVADGFLAAALQAPAHDYRALLPTLAQATFPHVPVQRTGRSSASTARSSSSAGRCWRAAQRSWRRCWGRAARGRRWPRGKR